MTARVTHPNTSDQARSLVGKEIMSNENDLKATLAEVNKRFGNVPDEWQRQMLATLGSWAGLPEQPDRGTARSALSYTEPGVREFEFGQSGIDQEMQYYAIGQATGLSANSLEYDDRVRAVQDLRKIGAKVPERVETLMSLYGKLYNLTLDIPTPDITNLTPENLDDVLAEYADEKVRLDVMRQVRNELSGKVTAEIVRAVKSSVDDVLKDRKIRELFADAAKRFQENYPVVRRCKSLNDAAAADETGAAVAAWHKAVKAAKDLDQVVNVIVGFAMPTREGIMAAVPRRRISISKLLGISAEPPEDSATYMGVFATRGMDLTDLRIPQDERFSVYGAQVDAGATLSLPKDSAELNERAESFNPYAVFADAV